MIRPFLLAAALALSSLLPAQALPSIQLNAVPATVTVGSSFVVNIDFSGATDLYYWEIDLLFSPAARAAVTAQATGPVFGGLDLFVPGTVNAGAGTITGITSTLFGPSGVNAGGTLAQISFTALAVGTVDFAFTRVLLGNSNLDPITISNSEWLPGRVTIVPVPEPAALVLAGAGLLCTVGAARHRRRRAT